MIRVLHVFRIMNRGGAETMIMNVYKKIDRTKIQFDFLCMDNNKGDYDDEIKQLGGNIYRISPPNKDGYIKHIKDVIKVMKENGPYKVVHVPTQFHSGIICLVAFLQKIPIRIVHSHSAGAIKSGFARKIYNCIGRILIKLFSTDQIACGEKARDFLFGKSEKAKKNTLILKNGIDINSYTNVLENEILNFRNEFNLKNNEFVIGHVGRFHKVKNHDFFIKLAEEYRRSNIKIKILLVGDGKLRKEFENKIKIKGLEEYFVITGKRKDIPIIMNTIDVFVMPSLYEGFPMTIIEALAAGKKCILSDTISKEVEIIENSVEFLNLEDDIKKWTHIIMKKGKEKLDKNESSKLLKKEGFDVKETVKILEEIYLR